MSKKYFFLVMFCLLMIIPIYVKADCSKEELNNIKSIANESVVKYSYLENYVPTQEELLNEQNGGYILDVKNRFSVSVNNLTDKYYAVIAGDGREFIYDANREVPNTAIVSSLIGGVNYYIEYYTSETTNCPFTKIKTVHIKLPYYNKYHDNELCKGIEEFNLCNKWYSTGNINYTDFKNKATAYKESLNNNITIKNDSTIELIIGYIIANYFNILIGIIILGLLSIFAIKYSENKRSKI
jgi:hypothetical protein